MEPITLPAAEHEGRTLVIRNNQPFDITIEQDGRGNLIVPPGAIAVADEESLRLVSPPEPSGTD